MNDFSIDLSTTPRLYDLSPGIVRLGWHEDTPCIPERIIRDYQICFRFSGNTEQMEMTIDETRLRAPYPCVLIRRPGERHCIERGTRVSEFFFAYPPDAPFDCRISRELTLFHLDFAPVLQRLIGRIMELAQTPENPGVADRLDGLCRDFMLEMLEMHHQAATPPPVESRIQQIASYLVLHFLERPDLEELARRHGYSRRSFTRHWRNARGDSPGEYVFKLRMGEAKRLLGETGYSVEDISHRLGYSQSAYFIHAFRRFSGMTPLNYRRSVNQIGH